MLAHLLGRSGRRVGLFTSPHLHRVGERVRIDGVPVDDDEIRLAVERVLRAEEAAGRELSFFELLMMAAWCIFAKHEVEVVVLEAGLGGRLDATSMRPCALHLLTSIALDHQAYLGDDLESIAREKAAVFHGEGVCLGLPPAPHLRKVVEEVALERGERLRWVTRRVGAPLPGAHQSLNAGLVAAAVEILGLKADPAPACWEGYAWPGRAETIELESGGRATLDVAHNQAAIDALVTSVEMGAVPKPDFIVFGAMADKPVDALAAALGRLSLPVWWAPPACEGAGEWSGVARAAGRFTSVEDPAFIESLDMALEAGKCALVCGSSFVVAPVRAHLLSISAVDIDAAELTDPVARLA
jgi:dihydrofolate synthase/folylpolyglutamate synthase